MNRIFGADVAPSIHLVSGPALLRAIGSHPPDAGPKSPRARLLAATAMLAAAMLVASPDRAAAQSNDACGAVDASGAVVCTPAGNPYPDGIGYATPPAVAGEDVTLPETPVVDLTIVLEPGVQILPDPAAAPAIRLVGHNSGSVNLISDSDNLVVTTGDGQRGLSALTQAGDISVLAPAIATYGDFATGLRAISSSGSTQIEAGDLSTHGYASDAIIAAGSSVTVGVGGSVFTGSDLAYGVFTRATDGNATVNLSGSIETRGFNAWASTPRGWTEHRWWAPARSKRMGRWRAA